MAVELCLKRIVLTVKDNQKTLSRQIADQLLENATFLSWQPITRSGMAVISSGL